MPTPHHFEEIFLSNGIPLLLHSAEGEVASIYWWNQVGSADERDSEAGFAHFLEHMLFKDAAAKETGRASTGQTAHAIESLGGDINAYTSFDQTVYHVTCAARHFEKVFDVFSKMAKPQSFLKDDFSREREVILEELRKNEDSPGRMLFQSLLSALYRKHPYGRPVIGYPKTLKAATVASLESFYRRGYVASRMGVVVVAPIHDESEKKKIVSMVEKRFGSKVIPPKKTERASRPVEPSLRSSGVQIKLNEFDVQTPSLMFAFRVPDLMHADIPALDLLGGILGSGELSRLYQKLFYEKKLVTDISSGAYVPNDPGLFYVSAEISSVDKVEEAFSEILSVLTQVQSLAPTEAELKRVIVAAESEKLYALQTTDGIASRLGFMKFVLGDLAFDSTYLASLKSVTAEKIQSVARTYLVPERMAMSVLLPKGAKKQLDENRLKSIVNQHLSSSEKQSSPANGTRGRSATQAKKKGASDLARAHVFETSLGMKVAHLERPSSHAFSIQAYSLGGLRLESHAGLSNLLAQTMTKGTSRLSANAISEIVEGSAASLDAFSGRNSIGLQTFGLSRDFEKLSSLFSEVLTDAAYPESELAHAKRVVEDSIRSIEDHTSQLCTKLFLQTLFEKHPYGRMSMGTLESVSAIDSEMIRRQHRKWVEPKNVVVSAVGQITEAQLRRFIDDLESRFREIGQMDSSTSVSQIHLDAEGPLKAPRWIEKPLGREQVHIITGGLGTTVHHDDRHAIRVLQSLLGGQSGPLFIELREKKSLAYTVAPLHFEGLEPGYVGTYIACAPSKRSEAIEGLKSVIESIAKKGPNEAALKRAKEFLLGRRAMDLQSDSSIASHFALSLLYGFDPRDEERTLGEIKRVSGSDIRRVLNHYYVKPYLVTATAG